MRVGRFFVILEWKWHKKKGSFVSFFYFLRFKKYISRHLLCSGLLWVLSRPKTHLTPMWRKRRAKPSPRTKQPEQTMRAALCRSSPFALLRRFLVFAPCCLGCVGAVCLVSRLCCSRDISERFMSLAGPRWSSLWGDVSILFSRVLSHFRRCSYVCQVRDVFWWALCGCARLWCLTSWSVLLCFFAVIFFVLGGGACRLVSLVSHVRKFRKIIGTSGFRHSAVTTISWACFSEVRRGFRNFALPNSVVSCHATCSLDRRVIA